LKSVGTVLNFQSTKIKELSYSKVTESWSKAESQQIGTKYFK
jgi:hypothetical protein